MLWRLYVGCVVLCLLWQVEGQINVVGTGGQGTYYLTKSSDCNANLPREIGQSRVQIFGKHSDGTSSVTSCTLTLRSTNIREPYRIKLQFTAVTIRDESTHLYIYDGLPQGNLLRRFSRGEGLPSNLDFIFTTGELVTFKFSRGELEFDFDINILVIPVPSESTNCNYENEGNCGEYGYSYRLLGTKEIAGIVAGGFGLVVIIVVTIICCCYCKQRGITKKWNEEKLGHINTAASLHSLNGHVARTNTQTSTAKPWTTSESARSNGFASIRRSPSLPRAKIARLSQRGDRDSSVTDSNASLPESRPLPPPGRSTRGGMSERSYNPRSERSYNPRSERCYGRSKSNEKFRDDRSSEDSGSYTTDRNFSEKNFKPPTYREALRKDDEDEHNSSADSHTFVQADESSSQKVFIERVITPRVKQTTDHSPKVHKKVAAIQASQKAAPRVPPPPEEDMEYDSIEPKKAKLKGLVDRGVDADANEETDESDTENESEEESESEETESEDEQATAKKRDKNDYVYSQPDKSNQKQVGNGNKKTGNVPEPQVGFRPVPPQGSPQYPPQMVPNTMGYPGPVLHHPQAQFSGYPQMGPPQVQGYPQGQGYLQGQPYYPPQNMAVQQPRPVVPPSYNQANFTVPLNQPQSQMTQQYPNGHIPDRTNTTKSNPGTIGNQPPVYSYLVNRGFMPMDGRHSPASNSTGASNLSGDRKLNHDDSDYSANIGSGVELLKRK